MYEYKVVPAPVRAVKVKGLKSTADRFAHTLAESINAEAAGGWQFQRTETMACEVRKGLGGIKTTNQTVMIFARPMGVTRPDAGAALAAAQHIEEAPVAAYQEPAYAEPEPAYAPEPAYEPAHEPAPQPRDPAYDTQGHQPADDPYAAEPYAPAPARDPSPFFPDQNPPEPRNPTARQEPLFRAAPLTRLEGARPDPVLRPPSARPDDQ